jgi:uncharacterized protein YvpB
MTAEHARVRACARLLDVAIFDINIMHGMTTGNGCQCTSLTMMRRFLSIVVLLSIQALASATTMAGAPAISNLPKAHGE